MSLHVEVQVLGPGVACLHVGGALDISTLPVFREAVERILAGDCRGLVVDMRPLDFLDSSGLGLLLRVLRDMNLRKAPLVLAGLNPDLRNLFRITGIERLFEFSEDPRQAFLRARAVAGG